MTKHKLWLHTIFNKCYIPHICLFQSAFPFPMLCVCLCKRPVNGANWLSISNLGKLRRICGWTEQKASECTFQDPFLLSFHRHFSHSYCQWADKYFSHVCFTTEGWGERGEVSVFSLLRYILFLLNIYLIALGVLGEKVFNQPSIKKSVQRMFSPLMFYCHDQLQQSASSWKEVNSRERQITNCFYCSFFIIFHFLEYNKVSKLVGFIFFTISPFK